MTITAATTERRKLMNITADHAATMYYLLKLPKRYESIREVNGHQIRVIIEEYRPEMDGEAELEAAQDERA